MIKLNPLKSILFCTATLVIATSCQPRDEQMGKVRSNNNTQFGNQKTENQGSPMSPREVDQLTVVSIEKLTEALHLTKALLVKDYASFTGLEKKTSEKSISSDELDETFLVTRTSNSSDTNRVVKKTNQTQNLNYIVEEFLYPATDQLRKLVFVKNLFLPTSIVAKDSKGTDIKLTQVSERIIIRETSDDGVFLVKTQRIEMTDSKKDKNTQISTEASMKVKWDGTKAGLDSELILTDLQMTISRKGGKSVNTMMKAKEGELRLVLSSCAKIDGKITFDRKMTTDESENKEVKTDHLIFTDSKAVFEDSKTVSESQNCETRPVVDYTRLL